MTADDYFAIQALVFRYAACVDRADYAALGRLFAHAEIWVWGELSCRSDPEAAARAWRDSVLRYADGTPRTRHVVTNLVIEPDGPNRAIAESYVMVFQQTDALALQPIIGGDYFDRFAKVDGAWRFIERRLGNDLFGDLRAHLKQPGERPAPGKALARPRG